MGGANSDDQPSSIAVPLIQVFFCHGRGSRKQFELNTLFWSLTRLFGTYHRIMTEIAEPRHYRPLLEADIENFIIWMRIVLNDLAFLVWQVLQEHHRDVKNPKGGVHPKNKEMSIYDLLKSLDKVRSHYPEIAKAFDDARTWIELLRNQRDNVVHFKSRAIVIETEPVSFSLINAGHTEKYETRPDGSSVVVSQPVSDFINGQMLSLYNFMHSELANALRKHIDRHKLGYLEIGGIHRMACVGIELFRKVNSI